jgi:hypothetical protein
MEHDREGELQPIRRAPAPASETLTLSSSILLMPGCSPEPAEAFSVYVVAEQLPVDKGFPAVAIAGPANAGEHPWVFAPIPSSFKMPAGFKYAFFVAVVQTSAETSRR